MHPARHDVIARTFRSWFREYRRFDLEKASLVEVAACRLLQPVTKDDVVLQLRAPKIEMSVLQTQLLGSELFSATASYGNSGRFCWPDDLHARRAKLDMTGFHLRISHLGGAFGDFALYDDNRLESESSSAIDRISRRPRGVERNLNEAGAIAEIDEHNTAEISGPMNPAAELYLRADVGGSKLTTQVSAPGGREGG
jgi:hypothetical protein